MDVVDISRRGVFSSGAARALLGLDSNALASMVRDGRCTRLVRGWYAPGRVVEAEPLHRLRAEALIQHFDGRAVASHHSAVLLMGLPLVHARLDTVRLCRARGRQRRSTRTFVMGPALGIPVTRTVPPAVAVVQSGLVNSPLTALAAADEALRRDLVTPTGLDDAVRLLSGSSGMPAVRQLLRHADARHESPGETLLAHVLRGLGLPATPQVQVRDDDRTWRVDFMLDDEPVIIEFDGLVKYEDGPRSLVEEKRREDRLRELGYEVVRVVWADLRHPDRIRQAVEAAVRRARGRTRTPGAQRHTWRRAAQPG
jgi:very-short-patch-repair endonuclease